MTRDQLVELAQVGDLQGERVSDFEHDRAASTIATHDGCADPV